MKSLNRIDVSFKIILRTQDDITLLMFHLASYPQQLQVQNYERVQQFQNGPLAHSYSLNEAEFQARTQCQTSGSYPAFSYLVKVYLTLAMSILENLALLRDLLMLQERIFLVQLQQVLKFDSSSHHLFCNQMYIQGL